MINIKKIIKEEMDSFDWVGDVEVGKKPPIWDYNNQGRPSYKYTYVYLDPNGVTHSLKVGGIVSRYSGPRNNYDGEVSFHDSIITQKDIDVINNDPNAFDPFEDMDEVKMTRREYNDNINQGKLTIVTTMNESDDFEWTDEIEPYKYWLTDEEWGELNRVLIPLLNDDNLRTGQSYMIALQKVKPSLYNHITGKDFDPWHDDRKVINLIRFLNSEGKVNESVKLPIEIGDTVYMGKFKNKKTVVKDIEWNAKGDLMINGKSALRVRIPKKVKKTVKESEFGWAEKIKSIDQQGGEDWIGRSFGYSNQLKQNRSHPDGTPWGGDDTMETFTITGVDEHGNLKLTKHHPSYGNTDDVATQIITLKDQISKGNWVWV